MCRSKEGEANEEDHSLSCESLLGGNHTALRIRRFIMLFEDGMVDGNKGRSPELQLMYSLGTNCSGALTSLLHMSSAKVDKPGGPHKDF